MNASNKSYIPLSTSARNMSVRALHVPLWNQPRLRKLAYTTLLLLGCTFSPITHADELRDFTEKTATPSLELLDMHGQPHTLAEYNGKVVLVNFWAGWCFPCIQEIPDMIRLAEILADRPFSILAVNVGEEKRKLPGFVKKMGEHMVVLMDTESKTFERWKGIGLPSTFVLDATGKIRYEAYGPVNWDRPDIIEALTTLMNDTQENGDARK